MEWSLTLCLESLRCFTYVFFFAAKWVERNQIKLVTTPETEIMKRAVWLPVVYSFINFPVEKWQFHCMHLITGVL
jgi:hypothetical protein